MSFNIHIEYVLVNEVFYNDENEIYKEHCFVVDLEWLEHMWSRHFKSLFQYQYSLEEFLNEYDPEYEGQVIYLIAKHQNQIIDECYERV